MKEIVVALLGVLLGLAVFGFVCCLFALPVMWLWNWLMPIIFGLPEIGFWQALGLQVLSGMLIRSTSTKKSGS